MYIITFLLVCGSINHPITLRTDNPRIAEAIKREQYEPYIYKGEQCFVKQLIIQKETRA